MDGKKGRNTYETPGDKSGECRSAIGAASPVRKNDILDPS
jgi:hypothetical protein